VVPASPTAECITAEPIAARPIVAPLIAEQPFVAA
jgi:hypothetical protein